MHCVDKIERFWMLKHVVYIYRVAQKTYTLFTHQYLWNKFKRNFYLWGSLKNDRRKPATLDDVRENIAMSCAAITLDTLQNVVHAADWGDPDVDGRIILRWIFRK
jgi:hypothetical protein